MKLARWIFAIAGVYGILVIAPLYFAEGQIAQSDPPAALASPWQTAAPCMHCSSRSQAPSSSTRK
jgi:hypothetical protein